jgi:hypothetical protein
MKAELQDTSERASRHVAEGAIFGLVAALSILPFIAFLVIGLGDLVGGHYWLSSLIVALVMAGSCGPLALRSFRRLKRQDLTLPRTRGTLEEDKRVAQDGIQDIRRAA